MKKTMLLAALTAVALGSAAVAAEPTAPMAQPAAPATPATPGTTTTTTTMPSATAPRTDVIIMDHGRPGDRLTSRIIGADVYSASGERIGDVNDLLLDGSGKVTGVLVGVGGFLGVGEKNVALAYDSVTMTSDERGNPRLTVQVSKEALKSAAPFPTDRVGKG